MTSQTKITILINRDYSCPLSLSCLMNSRLGKPESTKVCDSSWEVYMGSRKLWIALLTFILAISMLLAGCQGSTITSPVQLHAETASHPNFLRLSMDANLTRAGHLTAKLDSITLKIIPDMQSCGYLASVDLSVYSNGNLIWKTPEGPSLSRLIIVKYFPIPFGSVQKTIVPEVPIMVDVGDA
jgi:hypothetical protein